MFDVWGNGAWILTTSTMLTGLVWWTAIEWFPTLLMNATIRAIVKQYTNYNTLYHIPCLHDATMRDIVKPCPDLLYSCVAMDFTKIDRLTFTFTRCHQYRSFSFFDNHTNVIYVFNEENLPKQDTYVVVVVSPTCKFIDSTLGDVVIQSPTMYGIGLQRIFCPSMDDVESLIKIQQQTTCRGNESTMVDEDRFPWYILDILELIDLLVLMAKSLVWSIIMMVGLLTRYSTSVQSFLTISDLCLCIVFGTVFGIICTGLTFYNIHHIVRLYPSWFNVQTVQSWSYNTTIGGTQCNFLVRAYVAWTSILALTKREAIYMSATQD